MGVFYETIPTSLLPWIKQQQMLWVGTAPLAGHGHINVSPKGGQNFGMIDERTFWYMDLTGSGIETHAHLHEPGNGRICVLFMAFAGPPRIVRIWGHGRPLEYGTPEFDTFVAHHKVPLVPGSRSIILVDVHQCATSCGFSVPYYDFKGHRHTLNEHFRKKDEKFRQGQEKESIDYYWAWKSQLSMDGLPGMKRAYEFASRKGVQPLKKMVGPFAPENTRKRHGNREPVHLLWVLLVGVVMGGAMALSLVTPERLQTLQDKARWI